MSLRVEETKLGGVKIVMPPCFGDDRGFFSETYNARALSKLGIDQVFVQDNHSLSSVCGTVRGLHFQSPPYAQSKLVRVVRGSILDVAVDIRAGSPTFGNHVAIELSAKNWLQLLIPAGFAHGFCTLEPDTEVLYKVDALYSAPHDAGLLWNDPSLEIDWPEFAGAQVSEKDTKQPILNDLHTPFKFEA